MVFQIQLAKRLETVPLTRDYIGAREATLRAKEGGSRTRESPPSEWRSSIGFYRVPIMPRGTHHSNARRLVMPKVAVTSEEVSHKAR